MIALTHGGKISLQRGKIFVADRISVARHVLRPQRGAQAKVEIDRAQSSGRARIEVRRTTLAVWLRDRLYEVVNPQVRL